MAGNKIFYVTRTEDETTQTAGAATKTRADKPQLLKIVGVDHAGNPSPATPEDNQIYATEEEKQEILLTSDTVQEGDYNPVTSDAVFHYAKPPHPDWANAVPITLDQLKAGYTAPSDGMIVGYAYINNRVEHDHFTTINGVIISVSWYSTTNNYVSSQVQCPISSGDILKGEDVYTICRYSFVPWK